MGRHDLEGHNYKTSILVISDGSADISHGRNNWSIWVSTGSFGVNITEGLEIFDVTLIVHLEHGGKDWCLRGWVKVGPTAHI